MNDTTPTGVMRRPRPPTARTAAAIIAAAIAALLAAACGGSSTSYGQSSPIQSLSSRSQSAKLLAFSGCMRSHGVPQFPDGPFELGPPNGGAARRLYGVSGSQMWSAVGTCRHLLPPGTGAFYPRSEIPRVEQDLRAFARCMRSHGISQWPDPSFDSRGRLAFFGPGADNPPGSPTDHAMNQCAYLAPLGANTDFLGG
jgi:hypothetical protein